MPKLRTVLLDAVGRSLIAQLWSRWRAKPYRVLVTRNNGALELSRGADVLRIAPKHFPYVPFLSRNFDAFAKVLPSEQRGDFCVVDFAAQPDMLQMERSCLALGTTIESREYTVWLRKDRRVMVLAPRHLVYASTIAKNFDMYFDPLVPEERDGLLFLDFSRPGNLQRYAKSGLEFEMSSWPEEEETIEDYFRWYRPQPGDLVFDLGAHCGYSTYVLSKLVGPAGRVIAFEPDPGNFAILQRNMQRHELTNVTLQQAAIGGSEGKMPFNAEGTIGSTLLSLMERDTVGSTVTVEVLTLQAAFARFGTPRFCKVDIEGAEIEAFTAAGETLQQARVHLAVDTNHWLPDGRLTKDGVEELLRKRGYEVKSEAEPLWTTWARPRS